jgi:membrane protein implicated in regulation of membrane protease activity
MMRVMSFFLSYLVASQSYAASLTGEQLQLGLVTLLTFLVLSMAVTWMFKKWVKINDKDDGDEPTRSSDQ